MLSQRKSIKRPNYVIWKQDKRTQGGARVAAATIGGSFEIDTPMYSKIERGDRRAKREQVIKLSELLHQDEKAMLTLWLADKFIEAVEDELERDLCNDTIIVAQEKIKTM